MAKRDTDGRDGVTGPVISAEQRDTDGCDGSNQPRILRFTGDTAKSHSREKKELLIWTRLKTKMRI